MLKGDDGAFFALVSEAAFANPFGDDRERLDRELAGASANDHPDTVLARLLAKVRERLGRSTIRRLAASSSGDRVRLEPAILFDVFHRYADRLDALIQRQIAVGATSVRVPFGADVIGDLVRVGFEADAAARYFAFFYQLRRAYHFVARTLPGRSASMRRFRERLWSNVFTRDARLYARVLWSKLEDFSTLLLGETGTGKGVAAAAVGRSGWIPFDTEKGAFAESFVASFLSINLSQFPEALIESELFGHKRGAFTGAIEGHRGAFARCSPHGAIFLDEIGEVSVPVQIKLLRVLQERTFSPVGGHELQRFSGRVIAATNRPLAQLRSRAGFRDDFYYRLCSDVIAVPSLAARLVEDPSELDELLRFILDRLLGGDASDVHERVRDAIRRDVGVGYGWPGNVRELEQSVRSVLLTGRYAMAARAGAEVVSDGAAFLAATGDLSADDLVTRYCRALYERHGTYEEVARRTALDRRTVKAHVTRAR